MRIYVDGYPCISFGLLWCSDFVFPVCFSRNRSGHSLRFPICAVFSVFSPEIFSMRTGYINAARSNYIIKNLTLTIGLRHAVLVIVIEYLPDLVFGQLVWLEIARACVGSSHCVFSCICFAKWLPHSVNLQIWRTARLRR